MNLETKKQLAIILYKKIKIALNELCQENAIKCPILEHIEIDGEIVFWNDIKHEMENTFESHKRSESDNRTLD